MSNLLQQSHNRNPDDGHSDEDGDDDVDPPGPGLLHCSPGCFPGLVAEFTGVHLGKERDEDSSHDGGGDVPPADAEIQSWSAPSHQLDVLREALKTIEVCNTNTLKQRNDKQRDASTEVVVDGEGVVASVVTEHQRHQTQDQTN